MAAVRLLLGIALVLGVGGLILAEAVPLASGHGVIDKVSKDSITIRPRGSGGQFEKAITLKVTGTSNFSVIGSRKGKGKGKSVITQKKAATKDLEAKQVIAYIYTKEGEPPTLLSAVVQPADDEK